MGVGQLDVFYKPAWPEHGIYSWPQQKMKPYDYKVLVGVSYKKGKELSQILRDFSYLCWNNAHFMEGGMPASPVLIHGLKKEVGGVSGLLG